MNSPADDIELKPEKITEEKEGGEFHCDLYDMDIVYKIAQEFLPGLASACVDNTTGGLFSSPAFVAVDIRREMVDYLIQRSENFVAESVILEAGPNEEISKDPHNNISDFIDDFASSKRNFFSKVSAWLLSERREDKIDDFVQEMEINGFWLLKRRESIAQTLLKNVDFRNMCHCSMSFKSLGDLAEHKSTCSFRTITCPNEGCNSRYCAAQREHHDSICPFKILQCEQNCSESIMRREMDRHCVTVCPMKLVKCSFHSVGCHSSIPHSTVGQHRSADLSSHLLYILQVVHKEASVDDLKERVEELIKLSSPGQLAAARDARSLTFAIKDLEAKLGPLKIKPKIIEEVSDSTNTKEESSGSPTKVAKFEEPPRASGASVHSPSKSSSSESPVQEKEKLVDSPTNVIVQSDLEPNNKDSAMSSSLQENSEVSPMKNEDELVESPTNVSVQFDLEPNHKDSAMSSSLQENSKESPPLKNEDELVEKSSFEEKPSEAVKDEQLTSPVRAKEQVSVAELEPQRTEENAAAGSMSVQETMNESAPEKGMDEQMERASSEGKVDEAVKDEQLTSPVRAEVEEEEEAKEEHTNAGREKEDHDGKEASTESRRKEESDSSSSSSD